MSAHARITNSGFWLTTQELEYVLPFHSELITAVKPAELERKSLPLFIEITRCHIRQQG